MTQQDSEPWFKFVVRDVDVGGVEIPRLTRLLEHLSSALYAIARAKMGAASRRPGRRAIVEEMLADFRLVRVEPGSTTIELAPPRSAAQTKLPLFDEPTAEDVAYDFYAEFESIRKRRPSAPERLEIRRHVRTVIEDAGEIGAEAEIVYRPHMRRPGFPSTPVLRTRVPTRDLPEIQPPARTVRARRVVGHTYMVDVEPGRERLRVKLPDGRDVTMEVGAEVALRMEEALNRDVEIEVEEELEGETPARRTAHYMDVIPPSEPPSDRPLKSIEELEREQKLPAERPDYLALASAVWRTEKQLAEFGDYLREVRRAGSR